MVINLDDMTKEQLITVIANMHDSVQTWDQGWGLPEEQSEYMIAVGRECIQYCLKHNTWELK